MSRQIVTRFAPSPTGMLHIGGVRTALFCWAYAKQQGGTFVLRVEDTDRERSTDASVKAILDGMQWLGLDYEGPYFQMQRLDRYKAAVEQLLRDGHAYPCYATREEIDALREAIEDVTLSLHGSFSAEHGIGLSKLDSMKRRKDPVALDVMRAIKAALDPLGILNPGKVIPN